LLDGGNPWAAVTYSVAQSDLPIQGQSTKACMGLAQIEHTSCIEGALDTLFMHNNLSNLLVKVERSTKCETS